MVPRQYARFLPASTAALHGQQVALDETTGLHETSQCVVGDGPADPVVGGQVRGREGGVRPRVPADEVAERVGDGVEHAVGQPRREGSAQGVAQPGGVLGTGPALLAGHGDGDDLARCLEVAEGGPHGALVEGVVAALDEGGDAQRTEDPEQVGEVLRIPRRPLG